MFCNTLDLLLRRRIYARKHKKWALPFWYKLFLYKHNAAGEAIYIACGWYTFKAKRHAKRYRKRDNDDDVLAVALEIPASTRRSITPIDQTETAGCLRQALQRPA